jgi:hypothetical protein
VEVEVEEKLQLQWCYSPSKVAEVVEVEKFQWFYSLSKVALEVVEEVRLQ